MTDWLKQVQQFIWQNKEGAIIGGLVGWFIIAPLITKDTQSVVALQSSGLIDVVKSASTTATEFAVAKAKWFAVFIGVIVGIVIDSQLKEGFMKDWFR